MLLTSHPARVRGLKLFLDILTTSLLVAPRTGAWIETKLLQFAECPFWVAPRTGAWIGVKVILVRFQLGRK